MEWLLKSVSNWQDLVPVVVIMILHLKRQDRAQTETITELKAIKEGQENLTLSIAKHSILLEQTAREFARIEEHQRTQDRRIDQIKTELGKLKE